jgi:gliding motility-associated-like protein
MKKRYFLSTIFLLFVFITTAQTVVNFGCTGAPVNWVVPPCVTSITVSVAGAQGGGPQGGLGATVTGVLAVTPGQTLLINVGCTPSGPAGGFGGGGMGYASTSIGDPSWGGGGASSISIAPFGPTNQVIVAGGGGGNGGGTPMNIGAGGDGGCATGGDGLGSPFTMSGGTGGTQVAGGIGGPPWSGGGNPGSNGTLGQGGDGGYWEDASGGGGGGGYYGGGGGGSDGCCSGSNGGGGGAGGSSLTPAGGGCTPGNNAGSGNISISYTGGAGVTTATNTGPYCEGDPIQLNTAGIGTYSWTGPLGYTSAVQNPSIINATTAMSGVYTVTVTTAGCVSTATTTVTVNPSTTPNFTQVAAICNGGVLAPLPTTSTNGITGTWSPAINNTATTLYTFTPTAGLCATTETMTITVNPTPVITAFPSNISYCTGDVVPASVFGGTPVGVTYSWTNTNPGIGLGATGTGNTPAFTVANATGLPITGTISVTPSANGCVGTPVSYTITVDPNLNATITPAGPYCVTSLPVTLTAVDPGGVWSGTGITNPTTGNFDPLVAGVGTHTITYTIAGDCGDVQTTNIIINAMEDATITPAGPFCVDASAVTLTAASSGGTWSGTGITNAAAGTFNPATAGTGTHTITYITGGVCNSTGTVNIVVNALPVVNFSVNTIGLCERPQQPFIFYNTLPTGGITSWDFGDGDTGSGDTISHIYSNPDSYDVTLTITTVNGCSDYLTINNYVTVFPNPVADFTMNPNPASVFDPNINFMDQSYSNIMDWSWDIGGLESSILQDPSYIFPEDTGNYVVTLHVTDANGCTDSISHNVIILAEYAVYIPNAFTPDGDGVNDEFLPQGFGIIEGDYSFLIFNRWGEVIFETHTTERGWNGTYKGKKVESGSYVWKINFKDMNGLNHQKVGQISVLN